MNLWYKSYHEVSSYLYNREDGMKHIDCTYQSEDLVTMKYSFTGSIRWRGKDERRTENGDDVLSGFHLSRSRTNKEVSQRPMAWGHSGDI